VNFLDELEAAVTAVAGQVGPAVVGLGRGWGRGSGVVVAEGLVLTNAHVLRGEEWRSPAPTARSRSVASPAPTPPSTWP
jgi:S1-C subfamily serine protease